MLDDQLYYKTLDGVLLKYLNQEEARVLMGEVHEGICGAHQSAYKMKWVIRRYGYFWSTILEDCFEYYKGWMVGLEDLSCHRLRALENIEANKLRVAWYYNKKVKNK